MINFFSLTAKTFNWDSATDDEFQNDNTSQKEVAPNSVMTKKENEKKRERLSLLLQIKEAIN